MDYNLYANRVTSKQYDKKWESDPGYVFYDFNEPESIPQELLHSFDMVVIDPPFITHEVGHGHNRHFSRVIVEYTNY
jgi:hypothetical protein